MKRDKKIGLVLGLLLIGTVAAIFYRNEPESEKQTPHLKNPEALAEELKETDGPKPYLQDSKFSNRRDQEFVAFDEIETDGDFSEFLDSSSGFENKSPYEELPAIPVKKRSLTQEKKRIKDRSRLPSQPSRREVAANNHQTARRSSPQQVRNSHSKRAMEKPKPKRTTSASEIRIHRVRSGETLSSLATYYLGSDSRYMELYKLNKDILKNPNRLQVGMKLRIPPAKSSRVQSARTAKTQSASTIRTPQRAPEFLPVRRSPFSPGQ